MTRRCGGRWSWPIRGPWTRSPGPGPRIRAHVWSLICASPAGFPWLAIAGKLRAGWLVIDLDGTLITARSDKEGAAATFKMGYGFHPLAAWLANTAE